VARVIVVLYALCAVSCRSTGRAIDVAVAFDNPWTFGGYTFSPADQSIVRTIALATLRHAYRGFDVRFAERPARDRLIRVEETPYATTPSLRAPGAAGMTYPASRISSVRIDVLLASELSAAGCRDMRSCPKSRVELLEGLGRGVGATGAHELGHQVGIRFVADVPCDECYDGSRSTSAAHFFGAKHWSANAATAMNRLLPPIARVR
jgi:hypothetical protein